MTAVFYNEKKNNFYIVLNDNFYTVYLKDKDAEIHLLTAKNGKKYFLAELILRHSKKNNTAYFEAVVNPANKESK